MCGFVTCVHCQDHPDRYPDRQPTMCYVLGGLDKKLEPFPLYETLFTLICVYSETSENGLPLLRKPPQCGQESAVPNYSLYYSVCT